MAGPSNRPRNRQPTGLGAPIGDRRATARPRDRWLGAPRRHELREIRDPCRACSSRRATTRAREALGNTGSLIPVRKSSAWWDLPQDERRAIFQERSHHIQTGLEYLPAVARRLYHCRELGEPFDFLTWFEYSPNHTRSFEELVERLRRTEEWRFVEREVDIRLAMEVAP